MKSVILIFALMFAKVSFTQLIYTGPALHNTPSSISSTCTREPDSTGYSHITSETYHYNDQGQLTSAVHDHGYGDVFTSTFTYENDRLIKVTGLVNGGSPVKTVYQYNEQGQCISQVMGKEKTTYTYNEKNQLIQSDDYEKKKNLLSTRYTYNEKGELILEAYFGPEDQVPFSSIATSYDEKGLPVFVDYRFAYDDASNYSISKTYDKDGNLIKSVQMNAENKITNTAKYDHDDYGNIVRQELMWLDPDTGKEIYELYIYSYEYDREGNWVKMTTWLDGALYAKEVRTIVY